VQIKLPIAGRQTDYPNIGPVDADTGTEFLLDCEFKVTVMVINPREVIKTLVYKRGSLSLLVLNDDGVPFLGQRESVNAAAVLVPG
jgi:hypothetical protein